MKRRYANLDPRHRPHSLGALWRWSVGDRLSGRRVIAPPGPPAPRVAVDPSRLADLAGAPRLTWIGHASFLGSAGGAAFLFDPIFSSSAGGVVRRYGEPGLRPDQLPALDAVLISHAHYDHLDARSIRALPRATAICCPTGLGRWFRRRGFVTVHELDWWQSVQTGRVRVTFVPARHWTRRGLFDTNRSWWGGFIVDAGGVRFYHAGDSGWFDGFAEIGRRFPGILAAMLPIGAYSPAWFMEHYHMNPEQAGRAFLDCGGRHLVPMHWGTFQLTDEPLSEPVERLQRWWSAERPADSLTLRVAAIGETLVFDDADRAAQRGMRGGSGTSTG